MARVQVTACSDCGTPGACTATTAGGIALPPGWTIVADEHGGAQWCAACAIKPQHRARARVTLDDIRKAFESEVG